ncbi:MAG: methyltransferase domain-containing protein [Acidimicrobiales bacterium]
MEIPSHALLDSDVVAAWWSKSTDQLRSNFAAYVEDTKLAERIFDANFQSLPDGGLVVEIGSGIGLLSRVIASRGLHVVGYEPSAVGFETMTDLMQIVEAAWVGPDRGELEIREKPFVDGADLVGQADFVFAFNVVEHVANPGNFVASATSVLRSGRSGRFVFPNYSFPYEGHFAMPTLINKRLTSIVMSRKIKKANEDFDSLAFWDDLSWPTCRSIRRSLEELGIEHELRRDAACSYSSRLDESQFLTRGGGLARLARALRPLVVGYMEKMPIRTLPVIDLRTRN